MEGPWLESIAEGEPETAAITLRLLLAHMTTTSNRLMSALVLDRLDSEEQLPPRQSVEFKVVPPSKTGPLSPF